ncbi:hypothetical protein ACMA1D_01820 [Streptomyces sp. 796.1]|uniref:hypothetical protein n=1 Tax=Streptomyces sp. 796.1 TaxID=3163029 RepID=UPI0039C916D6
MDPIQIAPGLVLTEAQYELAAAGLTEHAPDLALSWERFTAPADWWLVPDKDGRLAKAELVLVEGAERTVKINLWHLPDLRSGRPMPHSHPWSFRSHILAGGYAEDRYAATGGVVTATRHDHLADSANSVDRAVYHEVAALHAPPGETMTLMLCGPGTRGIWGYLDPDTGRHSPPSADPGFGARLRALNPHRRA